MVGMVYARWLKAILPTIIVLCVIAGAFVLLKVNSEVGEGLRMILNPHSGHFTLSYSQSASVNFTLQTNNYLFCEALCKYNTSLDGQLLGSGEFVLHDSSESLQIDVQAPSHGEGKRLYELDVGCSNIPTRTCRRDTRIHRAAALVSVDYGPSPQIAQQRADVLEELLLFLRDVHDADVNMQGVAERLSALDEQSLDGLYERAIGLRSDFDAARSEVASASATWSVGGVPVFENRNLSSRSADLLAQLQNYTLWQHELASSAESAVDNLSFVHEGYAVQRALGDSSANLSRYANYVRGLARDMEQEPNRNVLTRMQEFAEFSAQKEVVMNESYSLLNSYLFSSLNESAFDLDEAWSKFLGYCQTNSSLNDSLCKHFEVPAGALWTRPAPKIERARVVNQTHTSSLPVEVEDITAECTFFGRKNTCEVHTPVLFLHGHSVLERNAPEYSLQAFAQYTSDLESAHEYVNGGALTMFDRYSGDAGEWLGFPVAVTGTYYYDAYLNGSSYITSIAKSESIDTYAIAVAGLVDTLRSRTGSDKVKIVAFSMGGLVARRYLGLFGEDKVDELILIGTPNHGIDSSVARFCPWLGANKECTEMTIGSAMLAKINDPTAQPTIPVTMIYGSGCEMSGADGDGIVTTSSAQLDWAQNIKITGNCTGEYLHTQLINVAYHPEVLRIVRNLLTD